MTSPPDPSAGRVALPAASTFFAAALLTALFAGCSAEPSSEERPEQPESTAAADSASPTPAGSGQDAGAEAGCGEEVVTTLKADRRQLDTAFGDLLAAWDRLDEERKALDDEQPRWDEYEANLSVFIDIGELAPAEIGWPMDPRQHAGVWADIFQLRAAFNDEWAQLAEEIQHAELSGRIALYGRYAEQAREWAAHWREEARWRQQAADLASGCRGYSPPAP